MKKTITHIFMAVLAALSVAGCGHNKLMSDEAFVNIFEDMYVTDTYCSIYDIRCDSLDIYTPIIKKYGYTTNDFVAKLSSFSKRKSARLSAVISRAVSDIGAQATKYRTLVEFENNLKDNMIAQTTDTLFADTLMLADRLSDSLRFKKVYPARIGQYNINLSYDIEGPNDMPNLYASGIVRDEKKNRQISSSRYVMLANNQLELNMTVNVNKVNENTFLYIRIVDFSNIKRMPDITLKNVVIKYMPSIEEAKRILMDSLYSYKPYRKAVGEFTEIRAKSPMAETDRSEHKN